MKMGLLLLLGSASAFADENATQKLLNAITVCPAEANPILSLKFRNGNSFANAEIEAGTGAIIADIVNNPKLINPLIMSPTATVGKIRVRMNYSNTDGGLSCDVTLL